MIRVLSLFLALAVLSACTEMEYVSHLAKRAWPDNESEYARSAATGAAANQGNFKVGNPYKIDGRWYYPREEYDREETGLISWYGPGFDGKKTANGERFDSSELTAAHRTLQMPSLVRVTNLENGRSLIVRVNDRGPYKRGRVMDVSERAAELLGFKTQGTTKAKLQVLKEESFKLAQAARSGVSTKGYEVAMNNQAGRYPGPGGVVPTPYPPAQSVYVPASYESAGVSPVTRETLTAPGGGSVPVTTALPGHLRGGQFYPDPVVSEYPVTPSAIYVQAGAFGNYNNALRHRDHLQGYFTSAEIYPVHAADGRTLHRVRIGPVPDVSEADEVLARIVHEGFPEAIIVVE